MSVHSHVTRCTLALTFLWISHAPLAAQLSFDVQADRIAITSGDKKVVEYVMSDPDILRPHFTRAYSPGGLLLTRANPPVPGVDAVDHSSMHPGIWMAWGDINGLDYWRNKARLEHVRFLQEPVIQDGRLTFTTQNRFVNLDQAPVGLLVNHISVGSIASGTAIVWQATLQAEYGDLKFGDQEEMGFGIRLATPLTEKKSGLITNSQGQKSAAKTWGQAAQWCDYSGQIDGRACGITAFTSPKNFRASWWHNRDYGLSVANPFAKAAMKQGMSDPVTIAHHESLTLTFGVILHDVENYNPAEAYNEALKSFVP